VTAEMVNCAGRGEHAPARAMLVHDQVAVLGSRGPVMTMGWCV
jgi:hypothetical protein